MKKPFLSRLFASPLTLPRSKSNIMRQSVALTLMMLLVASVAPKAHVKTTAAYAIKGARIVTVTGQVIAKGNVVMRNGLISGVGADTAIPGDAQVIDGTGMTVYPGLIDADTSLGFPEPAARQGGGGGRGGGGVNPAALLAAAAANPPDPLAGKKPELLAADEIKPGPTTFDSVRSAGVTTALTVQSSGIFQGQSALIDLNGDSTEEMVVKSPVALHVSFSGNRGFGGGYPGSLMGIIAYLRQSMLDAQHYRLELAQYDANKRGVHRPEANKSLMALQPVIKGEEPVIMSADSEVQIRRALNLANEFNLKCIIAGGTQASRIAPLLKQKGVPVLVSLNFPKPRVTAPEDDETESIYALRDRAAAPKNPAALAQAGVKFAFYSGGLPSERDMFTSVNRAIENGLSKEDALKALTINPAEIFGVSDQLGSIETGKIANLIVTDGDLFATGTKIKYMFIDGQQIEIKADATPAPRGGGRGPGGRPGQGGGQPGNQSDQPEALNLAGQWIFTIDSPQGALPVTVVITQQGETITGTTSSMLGDSPISNGKLAGNKLTFSISVNFSGQQLTPAFTGTVNGNSIKGTVETALGTFDFAGRRSNPQQSSASGINSNDGR